MLHNYRECRETARLLESRSREGRLGNPDDPEPGTFYSDLNELLGINQSSPGHYDFAGRRQIYPDRVQLRSLFEGLVEDGSEIIRMADPRNGGRSVLMEAGDAVSTANFSNIIGQIAYSRVLERLASPNFIGRDLVTTVPAQTQSQEQIPGIGVLGDVSEKVGEAKEYPQVGLTEEFITVEKKVKDGFIVPVTEEAIFEDKTGLLMKTIDGATDALGITWEKEILDTVLGITNRYSRNNGAVQATYGDTHTNGDFDNLAASNALVDATDVEAALLLFDAITDPNNGEPVLIGGELTLIVPTALVMTAFSILRASQTIVGADSAAQRQVLLGTPLNAFGRPFRVMSSQYVKNRTSSATTWFIGKPTEAFEYHEIWPIQKFSMDRNSPAGFSRDIVSAVKVRRKGVPAVVEPRKMVKCTA
jgi:hypothetical protein